MAFADFTGADCMGRTIDGGLMKKLIGELIAALIIVIVVSLMVWAVVAIWQGIGGLV